MIILYIVFFAETSEHEHVSKTSFVRYGCLETSWKASQWLNNSPFVRCERVKDVLRTLSVFTGNSLFIYSYFYYILFRIDYIITTLPRMRIFFQEQF